MEIGGGWKPGAADTAGRLERLGRDAQEKARMAKAARRDEQLHPDAPWRAQLAALVARLKQSGVARALGTNASTVSRWCSGRVAPNVLTRRMLAALYEREHGTPPAALPAPDAPGVVSAAPVPVPAATESMTERGTGPRCAWCPRHEEKIDPATLRPVKPTRVAYREHTSGYVEAAICSHCVRMIDEAGYYVPALLAAALFLSQAQQRAPQTVRAQEGVLFL